jgi:predicted RNA polymerase sigma factor
VPPLAARADLLRRAGRIEAADAAYAEAISCSANAAQRADLSRRRRRSRRGLA